MRSDSHGRPIVRVVSVVSTGCSGPAYIDDESKVPYDYVECAFEGHQYCTPRCAAGILDADGVIVCQRGITIGHLQGKFTEST